MDLGETGEGKGDLWRLGERKKCVWPRPEYVLSRICFILLDVSFVFVKNKINGTGLFFILDVQIKAF